MTLPRTGAFEISWILMPWQVLHLLLSRSEPPGPTVLCLPAVPCLWNCTNTFESFPLRVVMPKALLIVRAHNAGLYKPRPNDQKDQIKTKTHVFQLLSFVHDCCSFIIIDIHLNTLWYTIHWISRSIILSHTCFMLNMLATIIRACVAPLTPLSCCSISEKSYRSLGAASHWLPLSQAPMVEFWLTMFGISC